MCIAGALGALTILQIAGDYVGGCLVAPAFWLRVRDPVIRRAFAAGLMVFAPIEYIQPRIGWVQYRRCRTEFWLPTYSTWVVHALWDGLILGVLFLFLRAVYGRAALRRRARSAPLFLGACAMVQEVAIEAYQGLWVYTPTRWNPCWAYVNGRAMTLQQWHWAIIPGLVYIILVPYSPCVHHADRGKWGLGSSARRSRTAFR